MFRTCLHSIPPRIISRWSVWQNMTLFAVTLASVLLMGALVASAPATAGGFETWVRDFWPTARKAGVSRQIYRKAFAGVRIDGEVLQKARQQPEFTQHIRDYVDRAASAKRVRVGKQMLADYQRIFSAIERRYGVDRRVVAAIWGMESDYGEVLQNPKIMRNVIRSLATLAYKGGRRARYARQQLIAALKILQRGDVSQRALSGSWAGAMGHTQFIPTTYNAYAVDFDGDGRRNIWTSIPDALASTASYLRRAGWKSGLTWGYEVRVPKGLRSDRRYRTIAYWYKRGVRRVAGRKFRNRGLKVRLWRPSGANGPAFLLTHNFRVLKRYNNANAYALGVGHLADRLAGGAAFVRDWPRPANWVSHSQKEQMQLLLRQQGYAIEKIDGIIGPNSQAAIRAFQMRVGIEPDGKASPALLRRLQKVN